MRHHRWVPGLGLVSLLLIAGCASDPAVTTPQVAPPAESPAEATPDAPSTAAPESSIAWLDTLLTDAVTGKQFRLSDYKGKPVLLHAFATW